MFIILTSAGGDRSPLRLRAAHVESHWTDVGGDGRKTVVVTVSGAQHGVCETMEDVQTRLDDAHWQDALTAAKATRFMANGRG